MIINKNRKLYNHNLFKMLDWWIKKTISNLPIEEDFRRVVYIDFLTINFSVFKRNLKNFCQISGLLEMKNDKLRESLKNVMVTSLRESEEEAKLSKIPEIVIKKFNNWQYRRTRDLIDSLIEVLNSNFYPTNFFKLNAVFDILIGSFHGMLIDAEKSLNEINGELNGLEYKGIISKNYDSKWNMFTRKN